MGGFASPTHILLLVVVIGLLFGARRVPEIARGLGKGIREVREATGINELTESVGEVRGSVGEVKDSLRTTAAAVNEPVATSPEAQKQPQ